MVQGGDPNIFDLAKTLQVLNEQFHDHRAQSDERISRLEEKITNFTIPPEAYNLIRAEIESHQLASSKSLQHTKSLMDTAVAMVERKLNEKADFSTFQVLKENTEANIQHLEREMERAGLVPSGATVQHRVEDEASMAGRQSRLAVTDEVVALVHAHAGKLQDLDRRSNTLAAAMAEWSASARAVRALEEEVGELRAGTMKAFLDVRASLEAKPSLRQMSEFVERKLQPYKAALPRPAPSPPAGSLPAKQGDASINRDEQSALQAVAELRLAVFRELSTLGMKTDADRKRIHAAEEMVARMQEMIQEAMGRKANKTMVQEEISKVHTNFQKLSETTDKLLRHKAELRDLIKLQKDLQDLAHIQMITHQAAVNGRRTVAENTMSVQASSRDEEDSRPANLMISSISSEPFSQRLDPKKPSQPPQESVPEQDHLDVQEKAHLATLKFDTNNHNVFVPTAVKPPSTFYASKRNLLLEAEVRNKAISRDLPPVTHAKRT